MRLLLLILIVLVPAVAAAPAFAVAAQEVSDADEALRRLQRDFDNLRVSLQAQGGIRERDHAVIRSLADRAVAVGERFPDETAPPAIELQLSVWLEDHERVDALFRRLVYAEPDRTDLGIAWARYFTRIGEMDRADRIYDELVELYADDDEFHLERVRTLKQSNYYGRALAHLESREYDPMERPEASLLRSELLFAMNRFAEAVEAIDAIPQSIIEDRPIMSGQISRVRPDREHYVELWEREQAIRAAEEEADDLPRVELVVAGDGANGRIVVELFENEAPNTIANFITLAEQGFYDGTRFHRVELNFMAQGGDPNSREGAEGVPGQGGPGYRIRDEHTRDDHRMHFADSIAMANTGQPDTGGSQFYLNHQPTPHLNGRHTVFGRVLEGHDIVRSIRRNDMLVAARVLRKRDHDYGVETLPGL